MNNETYEVGEEVVKSGHYVCVPCGYHKHLKKGYQFPHCINCMDKKTVVKGMELWEKLDN